MADEPARNLIAGRWCDSVGGAALEDLNPANRGELLTVFPRSDYRDVDRAVEAARAAVVEWQRQAPENRAALLERAAELCRARVEELARLQVRESGTLLAGATAEAA